MNKTPDGGEFMARPFLLSFDKKLSARTKDENGYMRVIDCNLTKEQVVPYYGREIPNFQQLGLQPDKIYYMYRPASEIEKGAHTFNGVPLAYEHHEMTADSMPKQYIIGSIGTDAKFTKPYLKASLIVTDAQAINAIERGDYKQLSAAYLYDPVMNSGMFNGKHYDGIMTNLRGNHVALVREGRAGADVVVTDAMSNKLKMAISAEKERSNAVMDVVKKLKRLMAFDAVPAIEEMEVNLASLLKAVQVIEAQREGLNPRDIGLDVDEGASVEDIVNRYFGNLGDTEKGAIKAQLEQLVNAPEVEKEPEVQQQETQEPATNPAETEQQNIPIEKDEEIQPEAEKVVKQEEEIIKDEESVPEIPAKKTEEICPECDYSEAMDKCGIDSENADFRKAFSEGVKYGKSLNRNPEVKGEETKVVEETPQEPKKDLKAVLDEELDKAKEEIKRNYEQLHTAANDCKSVLGIIANPFAFDSASAIYTKALDQLGISYNGVPEEARGSLFKAIKNSTQPSPLMAQDEKLIQSEEHLNSVLSRLSNIKVEY